MTTTSSKNRSTILVAGLFVAILTLVGTTGCDSNGSGGLINNPATANNAEGQVPTESAQMTFKTKEFNFGTVRSGDIVKHNFEFTNSGTTPLVIAKATASCGCTVPNYPKEPIAPGQQGVIEVVFNTAHKLGAQQKTVTVTANTNPNNIDLTLTGEVTHPAEDGPTKK